MQLFSSPDADGEGEDFVARIDAEPVGTFTVAVYVSHPYLTATANDSTKGELVGAVQSALVACDGGG